MLAPVRIAERRLAPVKFVPWKMRLVKFAPAMSSPDRSAFVNEQEVRLAVGPIMQPARMTHGDGKDAGVPVVPQPETPVRFAPVKLAPVTVDRSRLLPVRFASVRSAFVRSDPYR